MRVRVWVVSMNESNSLLENKRVSTLIWGTCQITVVCSVKHFMAYYLVILALPMQHRMYSIV